METEQQKKARRERYTYGNEQWARGGTTGAVRIVRPFGAIPIRAGDERATVRGIEALRAGQVVELPIHPEPNSNQSREQVASWYAKGMFELARDAEGNPEALTPFEDAPTRAPDPDAVEAPAARIARLEAHIERLEQRLGQADGKAAGKK